MKTIGRYMVGGISAEAIITIESIDGEEVSLSTEKDRGDIFLVIDKKELLGILRNMA